MQNNYDDAWTFKQLLVETVYTKGATSTYGPSSSVTNESLLGTPGSYSVTYNDIRPPVAGEVLV